MLTQQLVNRVNATAEQGSGVVILDHDKKEYPVTSIEYDNVSGEMKLMDGEQIVREGYDYEFTLKDQSLTHGLT